MPFTLGKAALTALIALSLTACATGPAVYQAAESDSSTGFTQTKIESDRYRVSFTGYSEAEAYDLALLRAAEIAVSEGYSHFEVISGGQDGEPTRGRSGPRIGVGLGAGSGGYYGRSSGASVGLGIPLGASRAKIRQTLEVKLRSAGGDGGNIYSADEVIRNVSPG